MNNAAIHREFADARDQLTGLYQPDIGSSTLRGEATHSPPRERILIVAINTDFQSSLALVLGEAGFEVMTATTGEQAFRLLRDWRRPIDWLYTQAMSHLVYRRSGWRSSPLQAMNPATDAGASNSKRSNWRRQSTSCWRRRGPLPLRPSAQPEPPTHLI
jgi:hypothetical protein